MVHLALSGQFVKAHTGHGTPAAAQCEWTLSMAIGGGLENITSPNLPYFVNFKELSTKNLELHCGQILTTGTHKFKKIEFCV